MTSRAQGKSKTAEVVRKFEWSSTSGYIKADSITAKWEDGAWTVDASFGSSSKAGHERFHLRLPSENEDTPFKEDFVSQIPVTKGRNSAKESRFGIEYSWTEGDQYGEVFFYSTGMGGNVKVSYNPSIKRFEGSFHYVSPRQSNYNKEGEGTFDFSLQRPTA